MLNIVKGLFDFNKRELERIHKKVQLINQAEDDIRKLKDKDFAVETEKLKKQVQSEGKTLDDILPRSFALAREASRRILGLRHFDEQLVAGIALHEGKVAEQKTGEGKTLSAVAPLYLNALLGKGVHLVTVNDYLARRDAGWMGQIYYFLGLSVASMINDDSLMYDPTFTDESATDWRLLHLRRITRKEAYQADITYGINSEFGFDYLRDNMAKNPGDLVQRGFYYAIIDEVDSVLIDEARTPHIISAPFDQDVSKYYDYARLVKKISPEDFVIDEKLKTVHLNELGIEKIEKMLGLTNVYEQDYEAVYHIEAALKAHTLFKIDKDYIVKDNEVIIVDEFTGRLLNGRRFSEGLHQAIEAKENVEIKRESRTLATVSLQNYFRMYEKLAGMTGTAQTEAEEFNKIYKLDTLVIPTHQKVVRQDNPDLIYKTEKGKFDAVAEEIAAQYKAGRPVLVGTTSIEKNEQLSHLLKQKGVPHEMLNAKNHEREAHIISNAGKKGAITVATNMAGRGVDIVLGGETPNKFSLDLDEKEYNKRIEKWQKSHDEVVSLGGLYVMGTERHESRRIDNQLRGRSGRQGDPGETRFFVSLEDDLMRIFGGEQVSKLMSFFNLPEDQPLEHSLVSKALEQAQVKVEGFNFDVRKHLVEYDDVLNKQREILYSMRQAILKSKDHPEALTEEVNKAFSNELTELVNTFIFLNQGEPDYDGLSREIDAIFPNESEKMLKKILSHVNKDDIQDDMFKEFERLYAVREKEYGSEMWQEVVRFVFLDIIDRFWTEHLTGVDDLREGINLRGYGQLDPLTEYKNEAFSMFEKLLSDIDFEFVRRIFRIKIESEEEIKKEEPKKRLDYKSASQINPYSQQSPEDQVSKPSIRTVSAGNKTPGRNDPCWCGSGKKYKKCHLNRDSA